MCAQLSLANSTHQLSQQDMAVVWSHSLLVEGVDFEAEVSDLGARMAGGVWLAGWAAPDGIGRKLRKSKTASCDDDWAC